MFSYLEFKKGLKEEWEVECMNIFCFFDEQSDGVISRDQALRALELIGISGEEYIHPSKRSVTLQQFLDYVKDERQKNANNNIRRWTYIFKLIAGNDSNATITIKKLQDFFSTFGHTPTEQLCEDFIDEFDRCMLTKTEITLEDWISFCRLHRLPF